MEECSKQQRQQFMYTVIAICLLSGDVLKRARGPLIRRIDVLTRNALVN